MARQLLIPLSYLVFVLLVQMPLLAQNATNYIANTHHFSIEEGLYNRHIHCFQEDLNGFMWIGTPNGLHRFDGYSFDVLTQEKDSLSSNSVSQISLDKNGNLWLFHSTHPTYTPSSVDILNPETRSVKTFESFFNNNPPFEVENIVDIFNIREGEILISTESGALYQYTDHFEKIYQIEEANKSIQEIMPGAGNTLWIKSDEDILREINSKGRVLQETSLPLYANTLIGTDSKNRVLVQNSAKNKDRFYSLLAYVNPNEPTENLNLKDLDLPLDLQNFFLGFMTFDPEKELVWCSGAGFLFAFNIEEGIAYDFFEQHPDLNDIGNTTVIHFDKDDNLWVGGSNGFLVVSLQENKFTQYLHNEKGIFDQVHSTRQMLSESSETLIVNSYAGARYLNLKTGTSKLIEFKNKPHDYYPTNYLSILKDKSGALWLGSGYDVMTYVRGTEERWIRLQDYTSETNLAVWNMYEDQQERVWLGTNKGLYYFTASRDSVLRNTIPNRLEALNSSQILHFKEETPEMVWICTSSGLYLWNPNENSFEHFHSNGEGDNYLPFDLISHIYKDENEIYWLSTKGGGLIAWDRANASYKQYTINEGLSHNVLYAVYGDQFGSLWLPSDKGLMRFDKDSETVNIYFLRDGITHDEFNTVSHYQSEDGRIFFGGLNGITAFYPEDLSEDQPDQLNKLQISSFHQYDGKSGAFVNKTNDLLSAGKIQLPPSDKAFTLKVSLLDFVKPEKHRYAYQIEGLNEAWVYQDRNDISIHGLPYGDYNLRIKAQGSNGRWSANELIIPLSVKKPFFFKLWFIALVSSAFILGLLFTTKRRTRKLQRERKVLEEEVSKRTKTIRRQAEELKTLDTQKSRFFANVSHELRTPLTLILGPINRMLKKDYLKDEEMVSLLLMQKSAKQLLNQVNEILDLSKLEASKIKVDEKTTELVSFIKRIVAAFDSYAQEQGINLSLLYQGEEPDFIVLDQAKVEKIMQNLLSNAIKFTPRGGQIEVRVYNWNKNIQIKVKDSGKGIHPDDVPKVFDRYFQSSKMEEPLQGGTGIGLALARELALLLKGSLNVESKLDKGSVFTLELPKKAAEPEFTVAHDKSDEVGSATNTSDEGAVPHETASSRNMATILVVEDNQDMRNYIKSVLSSRYKVLLAENGQEGLKQLAQSIPGSRGKNITPDLILSDVMMPVMDGFIFMKKVKENDLWRSIPMVMLTARGEQRNKLQALRFGVDDYLLKPFDEEELLVRIHNLLDNYQKRKKWSSENIKEKQTNKASYNLKEPSNPSKLPQPLISLEDQEWLKQLERVSNEFIGNHGFGIERLSDEMALSQRQLFRRVRQLTGMTPKKYIQELRFQRARQLLETKTYSSVKAVSFAVGMKDVKYFSQKFRARFGKSPSSYL